MGSKGRIGIYLLFLIVGMTAGFFTGGEIIRRLYSSWFFTAEQRIERAEKEKLGQGELLFPQLHASEDITATRNNAIVNATRNVAPGVVGIVVTQIQRVRNPFYDDDFFNFFFGRGQVPRYRQVESIGSGFVIRSDGMILTNYHVVQNAAKLYVNFSNGRRFEGEVVGYDERSDLAVIAVPGKNFRPVKFGDSDKAVLGEWSIAIGNPFLNFINDAHPTVTVGVISALNRNFAPSEGVYYQGMIQTDAAINPGNSGGPLVNALGEVIGVNSFIFTGSSESRGSVGIGFAIPINRARRVAEELINHGQRRQVWTGISVQNLNRSVANALGYDSVEGVVVVSVQPGSPGDAAGLKPGDIIKRMGNRTIHSHADIDGFFIDYFVNDSVDLCIVRDRKESDIEMVLEEYSDSIK
ncbi:trypsin-like peptidase domain-containing protein [Chitinispirillales bacterium ANBcel5]|uniref:S1C family serine protease n=1 Tax=Cellulosispirillum alkaliphilum TaxID=3039283 RepID=UPI002A4E3014|nr:trypsin-like peptidase domain-containing protein [Chitinispirillales bacterium ANBcel5]